MRLAVLALSALFVTSSFTFGQELTEEQMGPWSALEKQVELGMKQNWKDMLEFAHPNGCFWGGQFPSPFTLKAVPYLQKLAEGDMELVAHHLIPVSVLVVDDVAIINFYHHVLRRNDDGEQEEKILRGHNTWKKEKDRWLLLATYNTVVETEDDD